MNQRSKHTELFFCAWHLECFIRVDGVLTTMAQMLHTNFMDEETDLRSQG